MIAVLRDFGMVIACACFACGPEVVPLELPVEPDTKSVLFGLEVDGSLSLHAIDLAAPRRGDFPYVRGSEGDVHATALLYTETLAELEIDPGRLSFEPDPNRAYALPQSAKTYTTVVAGSDRAAWSSAAEPPEAIRTFKRTGPPKCGHLEMTTHPVEGVVTRAIAPFSATSALAFLAGGGIVEAAIDHVTPRHPPSPIPGVPVAAHRTDDGTFYVATEEGSLWAGDLDAGFRNLSTWPAGVDPHWMSGSRGSARFELFTISSSATFARFDGSTWEVLRDDLVMDNRAGGIEWLEPGKVIAGAGFDTPLLEYDRSNAIRPLLEHILPFASGTMTAVAEVPGLDVVIATDLAHVLQYERKGARWSELTIAPVEDNILTVVPYHGGFLMIGNRGSLHYYHPGFGFCSVPDLILVELHYKAIARLDERTFVLVGWSVDREDRGHAVVLSGE